MKSLILIAALFAGAAHAQNNGVCLSMGNIAAQIAGARAAGIPEARLVEVTETTMNKPGAPTATERKTMASSRSITQYVFTMRLAPADARQLVYLKCLAGEFGRY